MAGSISAFAQQTAPVPTDKAVKRQLENLLTAYFDLKEAFVETSSKKAVTHAKTLLTALDKVEITKMTAPQQTLFRTQALTLKDEAGKIVIVADIEKQRAAFEGISISMLKLIKTFKPNATPVYQQFCPMAFEGKGAFWLSDQKQVVNPYFGSQMLHCGSVKGEF